MSTSSAAEKTGMQKFLDVVERVGNKVPHPAVIFLMLLGLVVVLSHVLHRAGTTVTYEVIVPGAAQPSEAKAMDAMHYGTASAVGYDGIDETSGTIETRTATPRSLLSTEGVRFMYTSLIPNFMAFTAVGLIIVAMLGVGVAEESGLIKALIRKLVVVAPPKLLVYIMVFVGIVSSIAADAGYLVLIPLAGAAFLSVGRHPLAGLAAGFAAVAGAFTVNMLIKPLDAVLVEFTNDAIHLVDPDISIGLASNLWFSAASVLFLTLLIAFITERVIERWHIERGLNVPEYAYCVHDRDTNDSQIQNLHTHVFVAGTIENNLGERESHRVNREQVVADPKSLARTDNLHHIAREEFEHLLDRTLDLDWRAERELQLAREEVRQGVDQELDFDDDVAPKKVHRQCERGRNVELSNSAQQEQKREIEPPTLTTSNSFPDLDIDL